jgi:hypothetical protein
MQSRLPNSNGQVTGDVSLSTASAKVLGSYSMWVGFTVFTGHEGP